MNESDLDVLKELDRNVVWHAFSQMAEYEGLIIKSADGCWLTDIDGNRYIDGVSSMWCNVHGHRHSTIDAAIRKQLDLVAHVTSLGMSTPATIRLAKRLVDLAPKGLDRVFFSSDGASAIEVAMKMAFQYWRQIETPEPKRTTFLAVGNAYHGDTLGAVSVGGVSRFHSMFHPLLFPVLHGPCPDTYRHGQSNANLQSSRVCGKSCLCSTDGNHCGLTAFYLQQYRDILERHHESIAAIIVEPIVQGAAGMIVHPSGFLKGLKELSFEFNTLLIADEVAVGMGRTGTMFACEQESVEPDFLVLGKGLSGGYLPMSATLTTTRIWEAFLGQYADSKSFFHGHTYGGNPLAAAAANATLDIFETEQTLEAVKRKSEHLAQLFESLQDHPHVGDVRQRGLLVAIELVSDKQHKIGFPWADRKGQAVCEVAKRHGVWLRPLGNVVVVIPPLSISIDELAQIDHSVRAGIKEVVG